MKIDYIVVGQGIAGTMVCHELSKANKSFIVVDKGHQRAASRVAAGLINPLTGRRYVKSWMIDDLIPKAISSYRELENLLKIKVVYEQSIIRVLYEDQHVKAWNKRLSNPEYQQYINPNPDLGGYKNTKINIDRFCELKKSFRIDLPMLTNQYRNHLIQKNLLIEQDFDHSALIISDHIRYNGITANAIIFAEGYNALSNPLFNYLPLNPSKGESIIYKLSNLKFNKILRHKFFVVPLQDGNYWSGGGYKWTTDHTISDKTFFDNWTSFVESFVGKIQKIESHEAAIRPTVVDRRPLIGAHPQYNNVFIFNGLGTKGASLAPYWAKTIVDLVVIQKTMIEDVDILRFQSLSNRF